LNTKVSKFLKKVDLKKRYHDEKYSYYHQNERCLIMARVNAKTIHTVRHVYFTTMDGSAATVTNSAFYSNRVTDLQPLPNLTRYHFVTQP